MRERERVRERQRQRQRQTETETQRDRERDHFLFGICNEPVFMKECENAYEFYVVQEKFENRSLSIRTRG